MIIDFQNEQPLTRYHLMTQTIIPRPIAWVLSENDDNTLNLAPFSFFNAICSDPPLVVMSIGKKPNGDLKDTRRNLMSGRDFVVHIPSREHAEVVNFSAATLDYGDSEVQASNLVLEDFAGCSVPRLRDCHVAYHCRFYELHELGPNQQGIVYAEIKQLYINDTVGQHVGDRYIIDASKLDPLLRLGGASYAALGEVFNIKRP